MKKLDKMVKHHTMLLKSHDPDVIQIGRQMDKDVKELFKTNIRNLHKQISDDFRSADASQQTRLMSRALRLSVDAKPHLCQSVNPDAFTTFMGTLQPTGTTNLRVATKKYQVTPSPRTEIHAAIIRSPRKKDPGPDKFRLELLQMAPDLFCDVIV